ncbi:retrovirus-related pol polyprotein from transposon TNT 1-94, partial [Tanacetum coccineum]
NSTNAPGIPSTGVKGASAASRSKPRSDTKKDRTLPAKSALKQVESHSRMNKSNEKQKNHIDSSISLLSRASKNKSWLWHRRLNHLNFGTLNDLARKYLVRGLPRLKFEKDHLCSSCQLRKSRKATNKPKTINTIMEVLHTLHMDLYGPLRVQSINGKKYILLKQLQVGLNKTVWFVWTDNGTEFVNKDLTDYYESVGITHEKAVLRTPQQNGVVERQNHTLVEAARTMLIFSKAPLFLWAKAIATACYT